MFLWEKYKMSGICCPRHHGFLNRSSTGMIIDEAQHVPALFSYIQTRVDENQKYGEYILSGSQNFLLLEKVQQSLAGRAAITSSFTFKFE